MSFSFPLPTEKDWEQEVSSWHLLAQGPVTADFKRWCNLKTIKTNKFLLAIHQS